MALEIDLAKDPCPNPKNYGLKDFHHNKDGKVDYAWIHDSRYPAAVGDCDLTPKDQSYKQDHEEHMQEFLREGWQESERIGFRRMYGYFCGGWGYDE